MKLLRILVTGSLLGGCMTEPEGSADSSAEETSETEQAVSGWYRVRWTVAGLYNSPDCGRVIKSFHSGHHVFVHYTMSAPPECSTEPWARVHDNYGNWGYMRFYALW